MNFVTDLADTSRVIHENKRRGWSRHILLSGAAEAVVVEMVRMFLD